MISLNLTFKIISPASSFAKSLEKCYEPKYHDLEFYEGFVHRSRYNKNFCTVAINEETTLAK